MAVRTNTEIVSQLPLYQAARSNDFPDWLIVTCPREECEQTFLVKRREWYQSSDKIGRSCPYCFMTSRLPKQRDLGRPGRRAAA